MHKDDKMTPNERMAAFNSGKPVDRYPIMAFFGVVAANVAGITQREMRSSGENFAKAQMAIYEKYGHDSVSVPYSLYGVGRALGSTLSDPEDAVPALLDTVLSNLDDLDNLDMSKSNLDKDADFKKYIAASEILMDKIGNEVPIGVTLPGVLTTAAGIYSVENILRAMYKEPEKLHKLLNLCNEQLKVIVDEFIKRGLGVSLADPIASGTLINAKHYNEFVKPYTIDFIDHVHKLGQTVCYHICGKTLNIATAMADTDADVLSLDNRTDLKKTRDLVGDRVCIIGNVDPVDLIMLGTPEEVKNSVKNCFKTMYDSPSGFMIATGCDVPGGAPIENVDAYMDASRYYGTCPIDPAKFE